MNTKRDIASAINAIPASPARMRMLLLLLLTLPVVVEAQFTYTTNNGTITITGYNGPGGAVTIPNTFNGLPVTGIGTRAFVSAGPTLTSVTIPELSIYGCVHQKIAITYDLRQLWAFCSYSGLLSRDDSLAAGCKARQPSTTPESLALVNRLDRLVY
jgi:hypothetical protein